MRIFPSPKNSIKWGPGVIDNSIASISFYALNWPKLNLRYSLTFEIISWALKPESFAFLMQIARLDRLSNPISFRVAIVSYF